jgi:uncharacterized protein (DUF433 family)
MAMATASRPITYPHISVIPGVRGGRACIDGTRISVMDIVTLERMGLRPEDMRTQFSSRPLTLAEVHAALTYYYDHKAEIDACFEEDREWDAGHEERRAEYLRQKARK